MQVVHPSSVPHIARTLFLPVPPLRLCPPGLSDTLACICAAHSPHPRRSDPTTMAMLQTHTLRPHHPAPHLCHDLPAPRLRPHIVPRAVNLIRVSPGPFCMCPGTCPCIPAIPLSHSSPASSHAWGHGPTFTQPTGVHPPLCDPCSTSPLRQLHPRHPGPHSSGPGLHSGSRAFRLLAIPLSHIHPHHALSPVSLVRLVPVAPSHSCPTPTLAVVHAYPCDTSACFGPYQHVPATPTRLTVMTRSTPGPDPVPASARPRTDPRRFIANALRVASRHVTRSRRVHPHDAQTRHGTRGP